MTWTRWFPLASAVAALAFVACDGVEDSASPKITVTPGEIQFASVAVGGSTSSFVSVSNTGLADLVISEIRLDVSTDFVTIDGPSELIIAPGGEEVVTLRFTPTTPADTTGDLVFRSNDPTSQELEVPIRAPILIPQPNIVRRDADVAVGVLDFGLVAEGTETTVRRGIENIGLAPLIICDAYLTGSPDFSATLAEDLVAARDGQGLVVIQPITIETDARQALDFDLTYAPPSPGTDDGELVIVYDQTGFLDSACAENRRQTVSFPIVGEAGAPFLRVNPNPVNFGETPIDVTREELVEVTNAGELPLDIYSVRLDRDRTPPEFDLPPVDLFPSTIAAGEAVTFAVTYLPRAEQAHAGVLQIEHADGAGGRRTTEVAIAGIGVPDTCPIAVARAYVREDNLNRIGTEIDWALPLQTLVLDGTQSVDPEGGDLVSYVWEITERAPGSVNGLRPFDGDPENEAVQQYFLPLAGSYEFTLRVFDESGFESCEPATVQVNVTPQEAISIEVIWTNPGDPDEDDLEGSDVDVHFVKMPNPWFHPTFDTYFANVEPNWSPELPSLDRDDTNGAGPETVQLDNPANDECYAIGVHYFRQFFGEAYPTVRIYIDGALRAEFNGALLDTDSFWDVARIHWPSRTIYTVDTYIENFDSDDGVVPGPTDGMIRNGHCASF